MPTVHSGEFQIYYEVTCPGKGPALLLVAGLAEQIGSVEFPQQQCEQFAKKGFKVVRMDNRDAGLSRAVVDEGKITPYTVPDLADDTAAVINDLGEGPVHVVGASLGGYIVRWLALRHPEKVASLAVVMSGFGGVAGEPGPQFDQDAVDVLMQYPERRDREAQIEWNVRMWRNLLWGNGYPFPEEWVRNRVAFAFDRSYNPEGNGRLIQALIGSPSLLDEQSKIAVKTLVMHGGQDNFFSTEHAEIIASKIPNAELWVDPLMGHIMHEEQWEEMADRLARFAGIES